MSTELISGIIGLISGTVIVSITNYLNYKREEKMRIFNQNLEIYLELSRKLVKSKLNFENKIAKLVQLLHENDEPKEEKFHEIGDEIREINLQFYQDFYSYAFLLPKDVFINLQNIYEIIGEVLVWDPKKHIFSKKALEKLEKAFNKALVSFSKYIGINNKEIEVKNPYFLTNSKRFTDKEMEKIIRKRKKNI